MRSFPVDSLLCDGLDEEGVGCEGVKVDLRGLVSSAAVRDRLPRSLHILEEGNPPTGGAGTASGPGQQALQGMHGVSKVPTKHPNKRSISSCEMMSDL